MQTKSLIRNTVLFLGLSSAASTCFGGTIYLASSATETTNNSGSATIDIAPNPQWSPAFANTSWISNVQSGNPSLPGYVSPANGTAVTFTDTFNVVGTPTFGDLIVMADDTTSVTLNGIVLEASAPTANNSYKTCSDFTTGCTTATTGAINLTSALQSGTNTLSFTVEQLAGVSFGLDYSGVVVSTSPASSATPEPGTLALFSLPLLALGILRKKLKA
jgi:hypothetical protein